MLLSDIVDNGFAMFKKYYVFFEFIFLSDKLVNPAAIRYWVGTYTGNQDKNTDEEHDFIAGWNP